MNNNTRTSPDFSNWNFTPLSQSELHQPTSTPGVSQRENIIRERERVLGQRENSLNQRELYISQKDIDLDQKERIFTQKEKTFAQMEEVLKQREKEIAEKEEAFKQKRFQTEEAYRQKEFRFAQLEKVFQQKELGFSQMEIIFQQKSLVFDQKEKILNEKESNFLQRVDDFESKKDKTLSVREHALREIELLVEKKLKSLEEKNEKNRSSESAYILAELETLRHKEQDLQQREALLIQREYSFFQPVTATDRWDEFLKPSYNEKEQDDLMERDDFQEHDQDPLRPSDPMQIEDEESERLFQSLFEPISINANSNSYEEENLEEKQSDSGNTTPPSTPALVNSEITNTNPVIKVGKIKSPIRDLNKVKRTPDNQFSLIKLSREAFNRGKKGKEISQEPSPEPSQSIKKVNSPIKHIKKSKQLLTQDIIQIAIDLAEYVTLPTVLARKFQIKMGFFIKKGLEPLSWDDFKNRLTKLSRDNKSIPPLHTEKVKKILEFNLIK